METKFRLEDIVQYTKGDIQFRFQITEIRIDFDGVWYCGHDEHGPVGWYAQKFLEYIE